MMTTETGKYKFTVKEGAEGQLSIWLEPAGQELIVIEQGGLHLNLTLDTSISEAQNIASVLNEAVRTVGYTE